MLFYVSVFLKLYMYTHTCITIYFFKKKELEIYNTVKLLFNDYKVKIIKYQRKGNKFKEKKCVLRCNGHKT